MTQRVLAIVSAVLLSAGVLAQAPPTPPTPDVLLKAAIQREQVDRDLAGALALYQALADKFPKSPEAADARRRMAGIRGDTPSQFRESELFVTGKADAMLGRGRVSPDGRYISFEDSLIASAGGTGNLAMWDTRSGVTTVINRFSNVEPWADGLAEASTWSPDGLHVAYAWSVKGGGMELRSVDVKSRQHRVIYRAPSGAGWLTPMAWSPDRRVIAVATAVGAGEGTVGAAELALVTVADGAKQTLRTFDGSLPRNAVFSADGRHIAFDFQPRKESPARDIAVIAVANRREVPVTVDADAHDVLLGWFADGHLLFTTDRGGEADAYAIRVVDGAPLGFPVVVKRGVGQIQPQGITRDNRVFVLKTAAVREIYVAELNPATGRSVRPPALLARPMPSVQRREPAWSPDGTRIAFVQSAPGVPESVVVQEVATNAVRVYPVPVRNIDWPLWQPDGQAFLFDGTGEDNAQHTFRLDLESGRVEPISDAVMYGISPDGRVIYEGREGRGLVRRNLLDGTQVNVLPPGVGPGGGRTLSPDGQWFAYLRPVRAGARAEGERPGRTLVIQRESGGEERVLVKEFRAGYARLAWMPDSRHVIFEMAPNGLHRVSIDGGAPEPLDVKGLGMMTEKSMNADGRRLAFAVSRNRSELWVWENVRRR